jgi:hypothetical protein
MKAIEIGDFDEKIKRGGVIIYVLSPDTTRYIYIKTT